MMLTVATADEMAEHERRQGLCGEPWPLVSVVWFERARRLTGNPMARIDAARPPDTDLWLSLGRFFGAFQ